MAVITIPFDYDPQRDGGSVVPIYLSDTDDDGETIFFGLMISSACNMSLVNGMSRCGFMPTRSCTWSKRAPPIQMWDI